MIKLYSNKRVFVIGNPFFLVYSAMTDISDMVGIPFDTSFLMGLGAKEVSSLQLA